MSSNQFSITDEVRETGFALDTRTIHTRNERNRIRGEFVTWINSLPNPATIHRDCFLAQLDRICPAQSNPPATEFPMVTDDHNSAEYLTQANDTQP